MLNHKFDVIVVGGGPAGIAAAKAAADGGCKVLLIEKNGFLGGTITSGFMLNWEGFWANPNKSRESIFWQLLDKLTANCVSERSSLRDNFKYAIDLNKFKEKSLDLMVKAKIELLLYTYVVDVVKQGSYIQRLIVQDKSGRRELKSKLIIDASGDGDIAYYAGEKFYLAPPDKRLPLTLIFRIGGIDAKYYDRIFKNLPNLKRRCEVELNNLGMSRLCLFPSFRRDELIVNMSSCRANSLDSNQLTNAQIVLMRQNQRIFNFLKKRIPGLSRAYIIDSAPVVGIRESRRIKGLYTLKKRDIFEPKKNKDFVIPSRFLIPVSRHGKRVLQQEFFISYRCLLPKETDNLVVTGRCISADHDAFCYIRNISTCLSLGEAAGMIASLSYRKKVIPRMINCVNFSSDLAKLLYG